MSARTGKPALDGRQTEGWNAGESGGLAVGTVCLDA